MTSREEFNSFVECLLKRAVEEFQTTEQYRLLNEKLEQIERDCETMLTKDGQDFAAECFELILSVDGQQEQYIYRKGLKDCVAILKSLGVLA